MKDASLTLRLPAATRRRIEHFAKRESRSLSQAAERLIELGLESALESVHGQPHGVSEPRATWSSASTPLAGSLAGGLVPTLDDFRAARRALSSSLEKRTRAHANPRR